MNFKEWLKEKYGLEEQYVDYLNCHDDELSTLPNNEQGNLARKLWAISREVEDQYKHEMQQLKIVGQKNVLMDMATKTNLNIRYDANCPLCAINNIHINSGIFFLNWGSREIATFFESEDCKFQFDSETIIKHRKHIVATPEAMSKQLKNIEEVLQSVSEVGKINVNNLEILQSRINLLTTIINELEKNGMIWTEQYSELNKTLLQFIDVKNKISSGEKVNVAITYKKIEDVLGTNKVIDVTEYKEID